MPVLEQNIDITIGWLHGWFVGLNAGLELGSGLLPTVWDLSLRMTWRHAITILIRHGANQKLKKRRGSPLWYSQRHNLNGKLEDVAPTTDFTCTRCH